MASIRLPFVYCRIGKVKGRFAANLANSSLKSCWLLVALAKEVVGESSTVVVQYADDLQQKRAL